MIPDLADRAEPTVGYEDLVKVEMHIGRVTAVAINAKARVPAYEMHIDFGPRLGEKVTSAQLTANYLPRDLEGKLVIAVVNLPPKQVAGIKSEVLVLAAVDRSAGTVILQPERDLPPGARIL